MSVPKSKQHTSSTTFFYNGYKMCDEIIKFLIRDFGTKASAKDLNAFTHVAKMSAEDAKIFTDISKKYDINVESSYPQWLLESFRTRIIDTCDEFLKYLTDGNTIYPNTMFEFNLKREAQLKAIASCYYLLQELQQALRIFFPNTDKYMPYVDMITSEISLLKKWRSACNKIRKAIEAKDVEAVINTLKNNDIALSTNTVSVFFDKVYSESYRSSTTKPNTIPNKNRTGNERKETLLLADDIVLMEQISTPKVIITPLWFNEEERQSKFETNRTIIRPLCFTA